MQKEDIQHAIATGVLSFVDSPPAASHDTTICMSLKSNWVQSTASEVCFLSISSYWDNITRSITITVYKSVGLRDAARATKQLAK